MILGITSGGVSSPLQGTRFSERKIKNLLRYEGLCVARSYTAVLHMALPMPRPIALQNGVYRSNVRVPADIAIKVRGTRIVLPVNGKASAIEAGDKVIVSVRTKDARLAKDRFAEVHAAAGGCS